MYKVGTYRGHVGPEGLDKWINDQYTVNGWEPVSMTYTEGGYWHFLFKKVEK